jgi:DNA modification methylase
VIKPYYEEDGIAIYHGDCREILPHVSADVLVTDPPYGIALSSNWGGEFGDLKVAGDENTDARDAVLALWAPRPAIVFGSWRVARPADTRALVIWDKGGRCGMGDLSIPWKPSFEEIYVLGSGFIGRRDEGIIRDAAPPASRASGRLHATEKPESLMRKLLRKCPPGVVLDPFMGSGTTLRAAKDLGRRAIGIELEEKYCEVAANRMRQRVLPFFEVSGGA